MGLEQNIIDSSIKQFRYYKKLADDAMAQLEANDLYFKYHADQNSIDTIIKHMAGNMKSRWTNIFEEDGEKPWRNRDDEFENTGLDRTRLLSLWEEGWDVLFGTLEKLKGEDLEKIIYIRNQGHTVFEAINRQLCHYSYHVGQICFMAKSMKGEAFESLSIPKNQSESYNNQRFKKGKERKHFTEDV